MIDGDELRILRPNVERKSSKELAETSCIKFFWRPFYIFLNYTSLTFQFNEWKVFHLKADGCSTLCFPSPRYFLTLSHFILGVAGRVPFRVTRVKPYRVLSTCNTNFRYSVYWCSHFFFRNLIVYSYLGFLFFGFHQGLHGTFFHVTSWIPLYMVDSVC